MPGPGFRVHFSGKLYFLRLSVRRKGVVQESVESLYCRLRDVRISLWEAASSPGRC